MFRLLLLIILTFAVCPLQTEESKLSDFENIIFSWNEAITDGNKKQMDSIFGVIQQQDVINLSLSDSLKLNHSMGAYFSAKGEIEKSLQFLFKAANLAKTNEMPAKEAQILISIGVAYYKLKNVALSLKMFEQVKLVNNAKPSSISAACNNIAALNYDLYEKTLNKFTKDSLAKIIDLNYAQSLEIYNQTSNYPQMATTYGVLIPWYAGRKLFDSATYFSNKALQLCNQRNLPGKKAFIWINTAKMRIWKGEADRSFGLLDSAFQYFKSNEVFDQVIHAMRIKAMAYDSLGNHDSAFAIASRIYNNQRQIFNNKMADALGKSRAKYQTQTKEIENQQLIIENNAIKIRRNRILIGALIVSMFLLLAILFYRNSLKKRKLEWSLKEVRLKNDQIKSNLESEEKERTRIARELHDGIGQQLSSIRLRLTNEKDEVSELVQEVSDGVRNLSHQMMPVALQRFGLNGGLESLVNKSRGQETKLSYQCFGDLDNKLTDFETTQFYRIAQELLQNIIKHSKATEASLTLMYQNNKVTLLAEDNGIGLPKTKVEMGMGMLNIQSRVTAIGGNLIISSEPGLTEIRVEKVV